MPPEPDPGTDPETVAEQVFVALADPTRRAVLSALATGGPATATDLAGRLPITRQGVAKHLALLADAGLVVAEPGERRRVRFRLRSGPMRVAQQFLGALARDWDDRLSTPSPPTSTGSTPTQEIAVATKTAPTADALPPVVDRATWRRKRDALLAREKAHTHEGDAIAAARRRLPMVEVDATTTLIGPDGPTTLLAACEGRGRLVAYAHMWHEGRPAADQCPGCTHFNSQVRELAYLHARDVTYATFVQGPYAEGVAYRDFLGLDHVPWYSVGDSGEALGLDGGFALLCYLRVGERVFETYRTGGRGVEAMSPTFGLLDMTVYGRGEPWEDSPAGWPQPLVVDGTDFELDGRPAAQWPRIAAGHVPAP